MGISAKQFKPKPVSEIMGSHALPSGLSIDDYDKYIVMMSGGKDSIASFLMLLEYGVPTSKIEFWHHCIDGAHEEKQFMDWEVTKGYCDALANAPRECAYTTYSI